MVSQLIDHHPSSQICAVNYHSKQFHPLFLLHIIPTQMCFWSSVHSCIFFPSVLVQSSPSSSSPPVSFRPYPTLPPNQEAWPSVGVVTGGIVLPSAEPRLTVQTWPVYTPPISLNVNPSAGLVFKCCLSLSTFFLCVCVQLMYCICIYSPFFRVAALFVFLTSRNE